MSGDDFTTIGVTFKSDMPPETEAESDTECDKIRNGLESCGKSIEKCGYAIGAGLKGCGIA